ncbi:hypothetical protein MASR2M8_11010 [Opitutaceae bacterium]
MEPVVILERNDQRPGRPLKKGDRPPFPKRRMQALAMRTHPLALDLAEKRMPAGQAMRFTDRRDQASTTPTQVPQRTVLAQIAAMKAHGRKHQIAQHPGQRLEMFAHPPTASTQPEINASGPAP